MSRLVRAESKPPPGEWADDAACRGHDPDMFFPAQGFPGEAAQAVCVECPVRMQCLEYGLDEPSGIWGGLNDRQRKRLVQRRRNWANKNRSVA